MATRPKKVESKGASRRLVVKKSRMEKPLKKISTKKKKVKSLPIGYKRVPVRRPSEVQFSAGVAVGIRVLGIEICQAVQDLSNSVSLIARKDTVVRVYFDPESVAGKLNVRGELTWSSSQSGPVSYLASVNHVELDPDDPVELNQQRASLGTSLRFILPQEALSGAQLCIVLHRVIQIGGNDLTFSGRTQIVRPLIDMPSLRVRVIGLRYTDPNTGLAHSPNAVHFSYLQSFLHRAYPVAELDWSQIVIDANFDAPFTATTAIGANAQLAAIRNSEINSGTDPRTHYYALVDDANGQHFMRGRATGIPQVPQPDTVASGPCGMPNGFAGDNDNSYADWYGAHELGHTYGRFHPGFPPGTQDSSDPAFPYPNGQISTEDGKYFGFDYGDHQLGLPMRPMSGTSAIASTFHDVMTYAERQWLSAHTYEAIRQRLLAENQQFVPLTS